MVHFSQMSREQLEQQIDQLTQAEEQAKQKGDISQEAIYRQKKNLARSYMIDPQTIKIGAAYQVEGEDDYFVVSYIHGVMAWGHWRSQTETIALPLATLFYK